MPGRDFTGPLGRGPLTGRGIGNCNDNQAVANRRYYGRGRASRHGNGFNRGFCLGRNSVYYHENYTDVQEKSILETEIRLLKNHLSQLETRLSNLSKED